MTSSAQDSAENMLMRPLLKRTRFGWSSRESVFSQSFVRPPVWIVYRQEIPLSSHKRQFQLSNSGLVSQFVVETSELLARMVEHTEHFHISFRKERFESADQLSPQSSSTVALGYGELVEHTKAPLEFQGVALLAPQKSEHIEISCPPSSTYKLFANPCGEDERSLVVIQLTSNAWDDITSSFSGLALEEVVDLIEVCVVDQDKVLDSPTPEKIHASHRTSTEERNQ